MTATAAKHRVIFRCLSCSHKWAREYELEGKYTYFRIQGGRKMILEAEYRCPECKSVRVKGSFVRGTLKEGHRCDARCEMAKGAKCECECAGANHGSAWLV